MKASRLIAILMLLQSHGRLTAKELASRLEVSTRTIYRDIDALSEAGIPIYAERGPQGGCALLDDYRTTLTGLSEPEVRMLFATSLSGLLAPLGLDKVAADAQRKLEAALSPSQRHGLERLRELIYIDPRGWFQPEEPVPYLSVLQEALWTRRKVRLTYRGQAGHEAERLLAPLGLVAKAGAWYVVLESREFRMVGRVSRVVAAVLTEVPFDLPPDFDLRQMWETHTQEFEAGRRSYTVYLRVAPAGVQPLRQVLGEGVVHVVMGAEMLDLLGTVEIELAFEDEDQACRVLLGVATAVEILAPDSLRARIRLEGERLAASYRKSPSP